MTSPGAPFAAEVARYLADCATHAGLLSPAHHPTECGALKLIWHRGPDQAEQVRAAFRAAICRPPAARRRQMAAAPPPLPDRELTGDQALRGVARHYPGGLAALRRDGGA